MVSKYAKELLFFSTSYGDDLSEIFNCSFNLYYELYVYIYPSKYQYIHIYLTGYLILFLSTCLYICLSILLFIRLSICTLSSIYHILSINPSIYPCIKLLLGSLSICLFIYLSIHPSIYGSTIHLSIYSFTCLSIYS